MEIQQIIYDPQQDRLIFAGDGIHCGDVLAVLLSTEKGGNWVTVRFEYSDHWSIVGQPNVSPVGLWAMECS